MSYFDFPGRKAVEKAIATIGAENKPVTIQKWVREHLDTEVSRSTIYRAQQAHREKEATRQTEADNFAKWVAARLLDTIDQGGTWTVDQNDFEITVKLRKPGVHCDSESCKWCEGRLPPGEPPYSITLREPYCVLNFCAKCKDRILKLASPEPAAHEKPTSILADG